jgi:hypothetical protein
LPLKPPPAQTDGSAATTPSLHVRSARAC